MSERKLTACNRDCPDACGIVATMHDGRVTRLVESRPVVPPPEGVKSVLEIIRELAIRTGLAAEFSADAEGWKRRVLGRVANRGAGLDDLRRGPVRNPLAPRLTFPDRRFPTATGRVNLVAELPLPDEVITPGRPLVLMALATERAQGSQAAGASGGAGHGDRPSRRRRGIRRRGSGTGGVGSRGNRREAAVRLGPAH